METFAPNEAVIVTFDTNTYMAGWIPETRMVWSDRLVEPRLGWYVVGSIPELGDWEPADGLPAGMAGGGLYSATGFIGTTGTAEYKWTADPGP